MLRRSRRRRPDFPDDLANESWGRKVEPGGQHRGRHHESRPLDVLENISDSQKKVFMGKQAWAKLG